MASPPPPAATVLCRTAVLLLFLAVAALLAIAVQPTRSASSSSGAAAAMEPTLTLCSGRSPPLVTTGQLADFLDALCAGAYGAAAMSHNMSSRVAENHTMYGVAQCRPDARVQDCAACLAAASSRLIIIIAGTGTTTTPCAAAAVWSDACFLRYSDRDPGGEFRREDEYTATVINASRAPSPPHSKVAVTRLLAAAANRTMRSHMCRGVGARTRTAAGGQIIVGLARCAAGTPCADCGRCLRGALAVFDREYIGGSAGMQVLSLSCMARYESFPSYNATSRRRLGDAFGLVIGSGSAGGGTSSPASGGSISAPVSVGGNTGARSPPSPAPPPPAPPAPPPPAPVATATVPPSPASPASHVPTPPSVTLPPPPPDGHISAPISPVDAHPVAAVPSATPSAANPTAPAPPAGLTETRQGHRMLQKRPIVVPMTVSVATGSVVVIIILAGIIWFRGKHILQTGRHVEDGMRGDNNMYDRGLSTEENEDNGEKMSCQLYGYQVLEAATCHFSSSNKIGSGGFGTVYKGTLENGKQVAVKRLRDSKRNQQELEMEISIVSNLRHKNLVRFLGHCFQEEGKFFVYEYIPNNSLEKFWYKASFQCQKLDWATWFNIIKGVARGLRFLHDKGILHRDLKPHNILLDDSFNPKIADFDLMRVYDKQKTHQSTERVAGTFGYMAPECTSGHKFLLSIKSDVYSYGVLVLEIITGHKIYTFEGQNSEGLVEYVWEHWREKSVSDVVDGDMLGLGVDGQQEHAARQALRCVHVALLCVQADRSRRPTMGQVIAMLKSEGMEALQEPSLPGYVVGPAKSASSGFLQPCLGCR